MRSIIYAFGFLLRFPVFILRIALITALMVPLQFLGFAFDVLITPWVFIKSAFRNDPGILERHKIRTADDIASIEQAYRESWHWLQNG